MDNTSGPENSVFEQLKETIALFAENIAKEVVDKRWYEVAEIKAVATTRLHFAITECVRLQVSDLEIERLALVQRYTQTAANEDRIRLGGVISKVNAKKRHLNRLLHTFKDYDEYMQLKNFLRDNGNDALLKEFFNNYLNKAENTIHRRKADFLNSEPNPERSVATKASSGNNS